VRLKPEKRKSKAGSKSYDAILMFMRCWVEQFSNTDTLPLRPFCRSCIIATRGYDFRKGQVARDRLRACP